MNNQKGEVVLAAMAVVMVVTMVFGMVFMHGSHNHGKNDHADNEQQQEHVGHDGHHEVK